MGPYSRQEKMVLEPVWHQRMLVEFWTYFEGRTDRICVYGKEAKRNIQDKPKDLGLSNWKDGDVID